MPEKSIFFSEKEREKDIWEKIWNARRANYGILIYTEKKAGIMAESNTFRDELVWKVGLEQGSPITWIKNQEK